MWGKKVDISWVFVGTMAGGILVLVAMLLTKQTKPVPIVIEPPPPTATVAATVTPGPLRVYVSGEVAHAAVYELPPGSIVADAIRLAGDFAAEAASERVNLAQPVVDGMQIHVPCRVPAAVDEGQPVISVPGNMLSGAAAIPSGGVANTLVNINTAGADELDTLPGIGPATAEKIIAHREANGPFATIEDIMEVSGIGEAKFEAMKELITVDS